MVGTEASSEPLARFGKYLLRERIGVGGMAEIFLASPIDQRPRKDLVIKRILPALSNDAQFVKMFVEEARLCINLRQSNIVEVYDLGAVDGQSYIAMEYIHGRDLWKTLAACAKARMAFPTNLALFIIMEVLKGLEYAHQHKGVDGQPLGIIHRDVSPSNVLLSFNGDVKLGDFGIAKANTREKTAAGVLKGKFGYMAPEQIVGKAIDHRADVFAVGILLFELLTGHRLFTGRSELAVLERVRDAIIDPPLRYYRDDLDPDLERIVMQALSRVAQDRQQSAGSLHDALYECAFRKGSLANSKDLGRFMQDLFLSDETQDQYIAPFTRAPDASFAAPILKANGGFSPEATPREPRIATPANRQATDNQRGASRALTFSPDEEPTREAAGSPFAERSSSKQETDALEAPTVTTDVSAVPDVSLSIPTNAQEGALAGQPAVSPGPHRFVEDPAETGQMLSPISEVRNIRRMQQENQSTELDLEERSYVGGLPTPISLQAVSATEEGQAARRNKAATPYGGVPVVRSQGPSKRAASDMGSARAALSLPIEDNDGASSTTDLLDPSIDTAGDPPDADPSDLIELDASNDPDPEPFTENTKENTKEERRTPSRTRQEPIPQLAAMPAEAPLEEPSLQEPAATTSHDVEQPAVFREEEPTESIDEARAAAELRSIEERRATFDLEETEGLDREAIVAFQQAAPPALETTGADEHGDLLASPTRPASNVSGEAGASGAPSKILPAVRARAGTARPAALPPPGTARSAPLPPPGSARPAAARLSSGTFETEQLDGAELLDAALGVGISEGQKRAEPRAPSQAAKAPAIAIQDERTLPSGEATPLVANRKVVAASATIERGNRSASQTSGVRRARPGSELPRRRVATRALLSVVNPVEPSAQDVDEATNLGELAPAELSAPALGALADETGLDDMPVRRGSSGVKAALSEAELADAEIMQFRSVSGERPIPEALARNQEFASLIGVEPTTSGQPPTFDEETENTGSLSEPILQDISSAVLFSDSEETVSRDDDGQSIKDAGVDSASPMRDFNRLNDDGASDLFGALSILDKPRDQLSSFEPNEESSLAPTGVGPRPGSVSSIVSTVSNLSGEVEAPSVIAERLSRSQEMALKRVAKQVRRDEATSPQSASIEEEQTGNTDEGRAQREISIHFDLHDEPTDSVKEPAPDTSSRNDPQISEVFEHESSNSRRTEPSQRNVAALLRSRSAVGQVVEPSAPKARLLSDSEHRDGLVVPRAPSLAFEDDEGTENRPLQEPSGPKAQIRPERGESSMPSPTYLGSLTGDNDDSGASGGIDPELVAGGGAGLISDSFDLSSPGPAKKNGAPRPASEPKASAKRPMLPEAPIRPPSEAPEARMRELVERRKPIKEFNRTKPAIEVSPPAASAPAANVRPRAQVADPALRPSSPPPARAPRPAPKAAVPTPARPSFPAVGRGAAPPPAVVLERVRAVNAKWNLVIGAVVVIATLCTAAVGYVVVNKSARRNRPKEIKPLPPRPGPKEEPLLLAPPAPPPKDSAAEISPPSPVEDQASPEARRSVTTQPLPIIRGPEEPLTKPVIKGGLPKIPELRDPEEAAAIVQPALRPPATPGSGVDRPDSKADPIPAQRAVGKAARPRDGPAEPVEKPREKKKVAERKAPEKRAAEKSPEEKRPPPAKKPAREAEPKPEAKTAPKSDPAPAAKESLQRGKTATLRLTCPEPADFNVKRYGIHEKVKMKEITVRPGDYQITITKGGASRQFNARVLPGALLQVPCS